MASDYEQWERLTLMEKLYITSHPQHAYAIKASKGKAYSETKNRFSYNGRNDASDAFRHCYWSSILSRELGFFNALDFTASHESGDKNPQAEKNMDLHNNLVGLKIGKQFIHVSPGVGAWIESDKELAGRCYKAYTNGQLQISPASKAPSPGAY